jgi:hypothetical protein
MDGLFKLISILAPRGGFFGMVTTFQRTSSLSGRRIRNKKARRPLVAGGLLWIGRYRPKMRSKSTRLGAWAAV